MSEKRSKNKGWPEELRFDAEDLRFATPKIVADYRAKKLRCEIIADLGSGVGMQSFAFAKTCKKVIGVEIDPKKVEYAKKNAEILGIKNVEFVNGDALKKDVKADIYFCDPERLPEEEERKTETISPNINDLIKKYPDIAVEFPPQIKNIDFDAEKEYLSVNGTLNRLTLYFGKLKKTDVAVVALPSEARMEKKETQYKDITKKPLKFLYDVDTAILKADMLNQLAEETRTKMMGDMLTAKQKIENPFFRNSFKVISAKDADFENIVEELKKNNFGQVVLRYKIDPKDYWKERKKFEDNLEGEKTAHLFLFDNTAVIAEKV